MRSPVKHYWSGEGRPVVARQERLAGWVLVSLLLWWGGNKLVMWALS